MKYLLFIFLLLIASCTRIETPDPAIPNQNIISIQLDIIKDGIVIKTIKDQCVESRRCTVVLLNNELEEYTFPQSYRCSIDNVLTKYESNVGYYLTTDFTCRTSVIKETNTK